MIRAGALAALVALGLSPARAETDPGHLARRAAGQLEAAAQALEAAQGASDRVAALTRTVQAYEEGLAALRAGLRQAVQRERALTLAFEAKREEVARLLGVLSSIGRSPPQLLLLHPSGPLGTARSGMILAEITPALQAEAEALRVELEELTLMRALQESAAQTLAEGLDGAQRARTALSQAVADRTDLPRRFAADPEAMQALADSAGTLDAFARLLGADPAAGPPSGATFETLKGELALPADGVVLRRFGEADAAGVARPGLILATAAAALVTAPAAATLRYVGPMPGYGNVMILEPAEGILVVLAGLGEVYGAAGEVVPAGAPLGLMGGATPEAGEFLALPQDGAGALRTETLYIEVRRGETPEDPADWFAVPQDR
jgi:septal ring factor EnvC (AmiA/AmiB activator)